MLSEIKHVLVDFMPENVNLEEGVVYISLRFGIAIHKCCCGCGHQTVTPLGKDDWSLSFHGDTISLSPSIGNFQFPCKSHYWITNSKVITC